MYKNDIPNDNVMCVSICSDSWVLILEKLYLECDFKFCCVIGKDKYKKRLQKNIGVPLFYDVSQIYRPLESAFPDIGLSQDMLSRLSYYESVFYKMMDRYGSKESVSFSNMSYDECCSKFYELLAYWYKVLSLNKPTLVLFTNIPHMGFDWVIYAVCKFLNIRTLMFYPSSPMLDHVLPVSDYQLGALYLESDESSNDEKLSEDAGDRLKALRSSYDNGKPGYVDDGIRKYFEDKKIIKTYFNIMRLRFKICLKKDNLSLKRKLWRFENIVRREKLKKEYSALSMKIEFNSFSYVYVALQVEPESQACPMGGKFAHQYLMVEQIASCLPKGWKIVIKEHINAFSYYLDRAKSINYYRYLLTIPNVRLANLSTDPYALIDNAKVTACVSGTTCWESVVRGVPTMLFGYNWFSSCEGVFQIHSAKECENLFDQLKKGYKVDSRGVENFLKRIDKWSIKGCVDEYYEKESKLSKSANAESVSKGIESFLRNIY